MVIGALDHPDAILAGTLYEDGRDTAGDSGRDLHVGDVDAARREVFNGGGSEEIVADAGDHGGLGAAETRRDGLVGALAAEAEAEFTAENGFTGARKLVGVSDKIDVGAADHHDPGRASHRFSLGGPTWASMAFNS